MSIVKEKIPSNNWGYFQRKEADIFNWLFFVGIQKTKISNAITKLLKGRKKIGVKTF